MSFYPFILTIIFAHFVGDYVFQSGWMSKEKKNSWWIMVAHCVLYAGCILSVLIKRCNVTGWEIPLVIFSSHWCIDNFKMYLRKWVESKYNKPTAQMNYIEYNARDKWNWLPTFADQLLHFAVLLFLIIKFS